MLQQHNRNSGVKLPNLHVSKNLNISKTKQDSEKLKTPLRFVWKCCSVVFKIGSKIFSLQWHFNIPKLNETDNVAVRISLRNNTFRGMLVLKQEIVITYE